MQQLPRFNTAADQDGHILYLYNAAPPIRAKVITGFGRVVPGDQSALLWSRIHPYEDLPKRSILSGFAELQRSTVTSVINAARSSQVRAVSGATFRSRHGRSAASGCCRSLERSASPI